MSCEGREDTTNNSAVREARPGDVTNVGAEVSEAECEERQEGEGGEECEGQEGRDVHDSTRQTHQTPPALPCEAAGRDGSLLSATGKC